MEQPIERRSRICLRFWFAALIASVVFLLPDPIQGQTYEPSDVDFDGSGTVTFGDFIMFAAVFGQRDPTFDVDGGGIVDFADFLVLVEFFGAEILEPSTIVESVVFTTPSGHEHPMTVVPAGPFIMGSDSASSNQRPMRTVSLDSFLIDIYEVTNDQFSAFLNAEGTETTTGIPYLNLDGRALQIVEESGTYAPRRARDADTPVVHVTWVGAQAYCEWLGSRLPTEAEWEKAARGTDGRLYPWGNDPPDPGLLNYDMNLREPIAVGSYPRGVSPYGVYDMAGNVFEWSADYYDAEYYGSAPSENPQGPESGTHHTTRGGAYQAIVEAWVQSTYRQQTSETQGLVDLGFRCARNP